MSTFQQVLNNAANTLKLKKLDDNSKQNNSDKGDGAFENSFAQGLDISELLSTTMKTTTHGGNACGDPKGLSYNRRTSAAEELLKIKEGERRQRQIQEEEEAKMQEALQKQLNSLKQSASNNGMERKQSSFEIGDALVRMHGTDEMAAAMLSQKANTRKGGSGGTANRRRNSGSRGMSRKINKLSVAKKSRHAKY